MDSNNKKMHLAMDTSVDIPGEGEQIMHMDNYFVDEWMYMKVSSPLMDSNWMKMRMPEGMWESSNQFEMQLQVFRGAQEVKYIGIEDIDGVSCYVVEITPGSEAIDAMMSQMQMPETEDVDFSQVNFADMIKEMSYKVWVAEDSYLLMNNEYHMIMEILPESIGATEEDFEKIIEDVTVEIVFYDYDEPVSIAVPAEALEAPDFPGQLMQ
jgi:hypothetical protein